MVLGFGPLGGAPLGADGNFPLDLGQGTYTLTGNSATFGVAASLASGAYTLTGKAVVFGTGLPLVQGAYTLTGFSEVFGVGEPEGFGSYSLTGNAVKFGAGLSLVSGSYSLTGLAEVSGVGVSLGSGSYSLTGQAIGLGARLPLGSGTCTLTGGSVVFVHVPRFALAGGTYFIAIQGFGDLLGFGPLGGGPLASTGNWQASLTFNAKLPALGTTYTLTGGSVTFARITLGSINPRLALRRRQPFSGSMRRVSEPQQLRRIYKYPTRSNG